MLLKLDLNKAYDRVKWDCLRLELLQVWLSLEATNWIFGCVSFANFAILINGEAFEFFKGYGGLREGCPLSPLLFLLIVEGLSRLINRAKVEGKLDGVKFSLGLKITHLIIFCYVLLFGKGIVEEWKIIKDILELFCNASIMVVSH